MEVVSNKNVGIAFLLALVIWFVPGVLLNAVGVAYNPITGLFAPLSYALLTMRKTYKLEPQYKYVLGSMLTGLYVGLFIIAIDIFLVQDINMSFRFSLVTLFEHVAFATIGGWALYWPIKRRFEKK